MFLVPCRRIGRHCLVLLCAIALVSAASLAPANAETHALLIGVGAYQNLDKADHLSAPPNDVDEMRALLISRGIKAANITSLVNQAAKKRDIENHLSALQRRLQAGDFLVFYFSGHGSYQPDGPDRDEDDGFDEVILPYDTEIALDAERSTAIRNAIVDDDLAKLADGFAAKGVHSWWILDSCHSGTGLRSGGYSKSKHIDPNQLGVVIKKPKLKRGQRQVDARSGNRSGGAANGRSVFFYAAQANERALELQFPPSVPPKRAKSRSAFTHAMALALTKVPNLTYRELIDYSNPAIRGWLAGDRSIIPQTAGIDGDDELLRSPVIGSAGPKRQAVTQWPVDKMRLEAGVLHGVETGAIVALYDRPDAADDRFIGYAEVANAAPSESEIVPIAAFPCPLENGNRACRRAGMNADARYARLKAQPLAFGISVSAPRAMANAPVALVRQATAAYEALRKSNEASLSGRVQFDNESPEFIWWVEATGFRLARLKDDPAEMQFGAAIDVGELESADDVKSKAVLILLRAYRVQRIWQLADSQDNPIQVQQTDYARPIAGHSNRCGDVTVALKTASLGPCTAIQMAIANLAQYPRYINVFLVDEDWNISQRCLTASTSGTGAILAANSSRQLCELRYGMAQGGPEPSIAPFARHSLMIVSSPVRGNSPPNFAAIASLNNDTIKHTRAGALDMSVDDQISDESQSRAGSDDRMPSNIKIIQWNLDRRSPR